MFTRPSFKGQSNLFIQCLIKQLYTSASVNPQSKEDLYKITNDCTLTRKKKRGVGVSRHNTQSTTNRSDIQYKGEEPFVKKILLNTCHGLD